MSEDEMLIVLDRSRNARAFWKGQSLWKREVTRVLKMLHDHVTSLKHERRTDTSWPMVKEETRPYLSIAVFGPSGSGKSSFLRTLVHQLNTAEFGEKYRSDSGEKDYPKVYALPVLQPDRFADHDHFLYAFLATALKAERDWRRRRETRSDEDRERKRPDALSSVQQAFQELSEFLRVIDEPEKVQDYDPLGLSLERLERHTSGLLLREKIGDFIDHLADSLAGHSHNENSVVLLPVDDADMAPEHLIPTLQAYQSFLLHPRLVPIFTFTDRTAEEVLRVHFKKHLATAGPPSRSGGSSPSEQFESHVYSEAGEGTQRLPVSEQLAVQYLARCFPVRNRLRFGPAPARVRTAKYLLRAESDPECIDNEKKREVEKLLKLTSRTLFGCPDRDAEHDIRAALRPSTLRRQLHIIDEMTASGMERYMERPPERAKNDKSRWVEVFNHAAWSLMNVHRDVLREYKLFLEDLYSWSPHGLQRVVLDTLLAQDPKVRRPLIDRWRYRVDSRRAQVLSLLAANVFRPWMPGEEPPGDESWTRSDRDKDLKKYNEGANGISAMTGQAWFLRLILGFYLPQVLAWNRPTEINPARPDRGRIFGVGWNLTTGPVNAIRTAELGENVGSVGMLFVDPTLLSRHLRERQWLRTWGLISVARLQAKWNQDFYTDKEVDLRPTALDEFEKQWQSSEAEASRLARVRNPHARDMAGAPWVGSRVQPEEVKRQMELASKAKIAREAVGGDFSEQASPSQILQEVGKKFMTKLPDIGDARCRRVLAVLEGGEDSDDLLGVDLDGVRRIRGRIRDNTLLIRCWSYYGQARGRSWAAISFWRGLGLVGRLLEARRRVYYHKPEKKETQESIESEKQESASGHSTNSPQDESVCWDKEKTKELATRVEGILSTHLIRGMVPGELVSESGDDTRLDLAFERWDLSKEQLRITLDRNQGHVCTLADRVFDWLCGLHMIELDEVLAPEESRPCQATDVESISDRRLLELEPRTEEEGRWSRSFIRRLQGDDVVGDLMARLNATFIEEYDQSLYQMAQQGDIEQPRRYRWNAGVALTAWMRIYLSYWRGLYSMQWMLRTCPLIAPFADGPITERLRDRLLKSSYVSLLGLPEVESGMWNELSLVAKAEQPDLVEPTPSVETVLKGALQQMNAPDDHLEPISPLQFTRFVNRLGVLPRRDATIDSRVQIRVMKVVKAQVEAVCHHASTLRLFHQIPRVLTADFRPARRGNRASS